MLRNKVTRFSIKRKSEGVAETKGCCSKLFMKPNALAGILEFAIVH